VRRDVSFEMAMSSSLQATPLAVATGLLLCGCAHRQMTKQSVIQTANHAFEAAGCTLKDYKTPPTVYFARVFSNAEWVVSYASLRPDREMTIWVQVGDKTGETTFSAYGGIYEAAEAGDLAKVKALLKVEPDLVSSKDTTHGWTPLHSAANTGHKKVVELLLANHADVDCRTHDNSTPLQYAALGNHKDVVELLLANKADVNAMKNNGSNNPSSFFISAAK